MHIDVVAAAAADNTVSKMNNMSQDSSNANHPSSPPTLEALFAVVGKSGPYQYARLGVTCLLCFIPASMVIINVFVVATPPHRCRVPLYDDKNKNNNNSDDTSFNLSPLLLDRAIPYQKTDNGNRSQCYMYANIPHMGAPVWLSSASPGAAELHEKGVVACTSAYVYDNAVYGQTFTQQQDLVCTRASLAQAPQTLYFLGILFGSFIAGWAADKYGRRPTLLGCVGGMLLFCAAASASPELVTFTVCRIFVAAFEQGIYQTAFVYLIELVSKERRVLMTSIYQAFFPLGEIAAAAVAAAKLPWRVYNAVVSAPAILALLLVWVLIDESVRWLVTTERFARAEAALAKIARANGRPAIAPSVFEAFLAMVKNVHEHSAGGDNNKAATASIGDDDGKMSVRSARMTQYGTASDELVNHAHNLSTVLQQHEQRPLASKMDILRFPNMRTNFFIQAYAWLVVSLVYYGLSMNISSLGGNPYVSSILISLVEIPSALVCWFGLDRFGRRFMCVVTFCIAGIATTMIAFIPYPDAQWQWLIIVAAMIGKLAIATTFNIVYMYAAEMFPTHVRTFAVGCASVVSRLGGMAASELALLSDVWHPGPFLLFGACGLSAAALCLILPETAGLTLPETVEDAERLKRGNFGFPFRSCLRRGRRQVAPLGDR